MVASLRSGELAQADPWDGRTLEWTIPSPPPEYNFARIPVVHGRDAFWLQKYGRGLEPDQIRSGTVDPTGAVLEPGAAEVVHVPPPSIFPLVLAAGILVIGIGMMVWVRIILIGAAVSLLAVVGMAFELPHYGEADDVVEQEGGLDNRKIGIWAFIGSETIFFASLISTYLIYKNRNLTGPTAKDILEIPLTSASTFILLMSSLLMVLSLAALQRADYRWSRIWLFGTIGCGLMFLGGQVYEFTHFYHEGLSLQTNLFGQTFFTLVGFHGAHVTIGVIWLMVLAGASLMGGLESRRSLALDCAALYWHFVDIVWIIIFSLIYLMKATGV
jgi:cytochrome c oxidase subunit 3